MGQGVECDCLAKKIKHGVPARCLRPRRRCFGPGLAPPAFRPSCLCAAPPAAMGNVANRKLYIQGVLPGARENELKKAYRKLDQEYHPDRIQMLMTNSKK